MSDAPSGAARPKVFGPIIGPRYSSSYNNLIIYNSAVSATVSFRSHKLIGRKLVGVLDLLNSALHCIAPLLIIIKALSTRQLNETQTY